MQKLSLKKSKVACTDPSAQGFTFLIDFGDKECGEVMRCSAGIARNKLNPDQESNRLSLDEAVLLSEQFNDDRQLSAWAAKRGKVLVDIPKDCACEEELADQLLLVSEVIGSLNREIREARHDGIIDPQERQQIQAKALEAVQSIMNLDAEIGSQVREIPKIKGL